MRKQIVALAVLAVAAGGALYLSQGPAAGKPPVQPAEANPANGKRLYAEHCASCHGADLEGQEGWRTAQGDGPAPAPPHDQTGHTWHHGDGLLFTYTRLGGQAALGARGVNFESGMPGFEGTLSDLEIWDVLAFIKSTWPARVQEIQRVRTEAEQMSSR